MRRIFKFVHPLLLICLVLFALAACFLRGQGGPCPSPLILVFPLIGLGILLGLALSLVRIIKCFHQKNQAKKESH